MYLPEINLKRTLKLYFESLIQCETLQIINILFFFKNGLLFWVPALALLNAVTLIK